MIKLYDWTNPDGYCHMGKGEPMNNKEAVNWLINILADIGKVEHSDLWHYEQALTEIKDMLESAQPERTCVNCGRTANNGGWYADGRTRCPIEEHYALPKDGYCHLWEKRNVWDDDYPERRTDE